MSESTRDRTVDRLLRQQAALAAFGSFAFRETDLSAILNEAARICAASLGVPFCKICRFRPVEGDLLIEAGCGWNAGVVGRVVSQANETSPQGRAYVTGEPVIIHSLREGNNLSLPDFYPQHGIVSTVDVVIPAVDGPPYGVLEIDSPVRHHYDVHDINFLTGFANVLAEAVSSANKNTAMRNLVAQQKLMAEELQHRVRNNLQVVSGMLAGYAKSASEGEMQESIGSMSRRVMTLAQVYDSLLGVGLSRTIDLSDYLKALCASLPGLQEVPVDKICLAYHAASVRLPLDSVTSLGLVMVELVTNSFAHAFPYYEGKITVRLTHDVLAAHATLTIEDDGIGFVPDLQSLRRGTSLVRRLVDHIGGTIEVFCSTGTRWTVRFPVPDSADGLKTAA